MWLSETENDTDEKSIEEKLESTSLGKTEAKLQSSPDQKEKLFFMLLGLGLEHLSNTTGLGQLSDETIESILESLEYLLKTSFAQDLVLSRSVHLCVEILAIFYKVKLTRDSMSINLLVLRIVNQILELQNSTHATESDIKVNQTKREKNKTSLIFVVLEICIRDLIKYLPNLLETDQNSSKQSSMLNHQKNSFLHMHVITCKQLGKKDIELLGSVMDVLNKIPFQLDVKPESK